MTPLKPYPKLYTHREMLEIVRAEVVRALMPYKLKHEQLAAIIKDIKKRYANSH